MNLRALRCSLLNNDGYLADDLIMHLFAQLLLEFLSGDLRIVNCGCDLMELFDELVAQSCATDRTNAESAGKAEVEQRVWLRGIQVIEPGPIGGVSCPWFRSEERRVGKECRSRWSPYH